MQESFIGFNGKKYNPATPHVGTYEMSNDGRFWHISFPIEDEAGGRQIYRGRNLPRAADHDLWVYYRPYPPGLRRLTA
jgi:hypothetical protein